MFFHCNLNCILSKKLYHWYLSCCEINHDWFECACSVHSLALGRTIFPALASHGAPWLCCGKEPSVKPLPLLSAVNVPTNSLSHFKSLPQCEETPTLFHLIMLSTCMTMLAVFWYQRMLLSTLCMSSVLANCFFLLQFICRIFTPLCSLHRIPLLFSMFLHACHFCCASRGVWFLPA